MWNRLAKPLVALSIGLNVAFIAIWLVYAVPVPPTGEQPVKGPEENGSDYLHRKIGVTTDQWQQIEPHIQNFQKNAQSQRRTVIALRRELMALLAAPGVAEKDIQSKQKEIMAAKRAMQDLVIGLLLREKKILNQEQFRELIKAIQQNCDCNGTEGSRKKGPLGHF